MIKSVEMTPLQKAALAIKELRGRLNAAEAAKTEGIAITGLACRLPGAKNAEDYWQLLSEGRDAITEVPLSRWDLNYYFDSNPNAAGKVNTRYGGFLSDVDGFDAAFFGISPQEAERMDPQQRILLQSAWHALEDAGQPPAEIRGTRTGVFVGITQGDYGMMQLAGPENEIQAYTGTGNGFCFASGRLSFNLGLQGPSFSVDTACSSSLVALHQACVALKTGECDLALVAGVQLNLAPQMQIFLSRTQSFSPDGRCRSFDAQANGFVLSEGIGVVVLRRLSDAKARGDKVRAVICGSAVNHGGGASGLTVPNELAQEQLIRDALVNARLRPDDIDYIEAHGSATKLGDPIEVGALRAVFGERADERPLWMGSVKSNLGHLSAASGVAGLIKTVLMLEHQKIAPNLHFVTPSPRIDWDGFTVNVPTSKVPWAKGEGPRRAGVSAFGLSGTNAHIVLEEAPAIEQGSVKIAERPLHVLALSARTPAALLVLAQSYATLPPEMCLTDLCFSANTGRNHFANRLSLKAANLAKLYQQLNAYVAGKLNHLASSVSGSGPDQLIWAFQENVNTSSVRVLAETEPNVAEALERCDALEPRGPDAERLTALIALAAMWKAWGLQPDGVTGAGVGLFAAHYVAGVYDLEAVFRALAGQTVLTKPPHLIVHNVMPAQSETRFVEIGAANWDFLTEQLTDLYLKGFDINWNGFDKGRGRRRVCLPGYPFEESRFWFNSLVVRSSESPAKPENLPEKVLIGAVSNSMPEFLVQQQSIATGALKHIIQMQTAFLASSPVPTASPPNILTKKEVPVNVNNLNSIGRWSTLRLAASTKNGIDLHVGSLQSNDCAGESGIIGDGDHRAVLVHEGAKDIKEGISDQKRLLRSKAKTGRSIVFMFPGVGDHYLQMAQGLYHHVSAFRAVVDHCSLFLQPLLGYDIRKVIWPAAAKVLKSKNTAADNIDIRAMLNRDNSSSSAEDMLLNQTINSQPAVFVIEYALGRLWQLEGVNPDAMIGYSIGEYTAACMAGVISLEDTLRLIASRARLIDQLPPGVLLAVPLSETRLRPILAEEVSIALISTPTMCVVGGSEEAILELEGRLAQQEVVFRRLPGTQAFHSQMLEPIHKRLVDLMSSFKLNPPVIPYISNVTGTWITPQQATDPDHWARHTWQTVRFADGLSELLNQEGRIFLEVGPGQSLCSFVLQHPAAQNLKDKFTLSSLRNRYERQMDETHFLTTAGKIWLTGALDPKLSDNLPIGDK